MNKKVLTLLNKLKEPQETVTLADGSEVHSPDHSPTETEKVGRRSFLQKAGLGGLSLSSFMFASTEDQLDHATQKVNKNSNPSELKITDLRIAEVQGAPFRCPLVRIDTNQGIYDLGEVRDNASMRYALFLKSRLMGENPCNVNRVFKKIKQFGHHGRQGGGVSAVEMALWDLTGKAYNVPVYQLLGGKFRDKVRLYADTTNVRAKDKDEYTNVVKGRIAKGFNFLKIDIELDMIQDIPGALVNHKQYGKLQGYSSEYGSYGQMEHPFTAIQITDKGAKALADYVARIRDAVGYDIPMAADHFGHFGVNGCIKLARALEPYQIAWLEDLVPWKYTDMWKEITQAIELPTMTGEDIFLKEEFVKLIDARAVDMIHPDLATAGGILETKKIGDYAEDHGIPMAMHFAGTPVSFMANVHCAAATQNFVALEHHSIDVPWWEDMVTDIDKPMVKDGFVTVPNKPGLGIELNEKVVKEHLVKDTGYFLPTPEWDKDRSWDRLWS
jgi:L-alanine-DL-glutamate epimerase-like enolase superfamily enzyme